MGAFGFYLYCRIKRTISVHSNVFAYQVHLPLSHIHANHLIHAFHSKYT